MKTEKKESLIEMIVAIILVIGVPLAFVVGMLLVDEHQIWVRDKYGFSTSAK